MSDNNYYRTDNNELASDPKLITAKIGEMELKFKTDNGVFSKDYLDYATRILLESLDELKGKTLLDVGCGYGPIGIYLGKKYSLDVTMIDINERAINLAKENVEINSFKADVLISDCLDEVLNNKYDIIISNPPIRAGKAVIYKMFEQAAKVLNENGSFYIVIQQKHGAPSAIKKLSEIYSAVDVIYKKKGFFIIKCK